jgi:transposase
LTLAPHPAILHSMYIKKVKKQNPGAKKAYEYLHLVENVRTEKGPRQRLILNLGTIDVPPEKYKELANCIEAMLSGQQTLFSLDPKIESHARQAVHDIVKKRSEEQALAKTLGGKTDPAPDYQHVNVASIEVAEPRSLGPEYVCHSIWKELGIHELLLSQSVSPPSLSIIETLVLGRLIFPASERQTWEWAQRRSAVYELAGTPLKGSLNSFYRATDTLFQHKDAIEAYLSKKEKEIFSLAETLCLFDLTNTHFEGRAMGNPKARFGRSKQKRSDCKLLTLALIIDELGFIKYSHLYPGNQQETRTLGEMIESLVALRPDLAKNRTVIMDAGIATEDNLAYLRQNSFHYIVVNRGKSDFTPDDTVGMKIIRQEDEFTIEVCRKEKDQEALLLCRSAGRIEKDKGIRNRQEQLFLERLAYYRSGLSKKGHTKVYSKVLELIGRLREKYPKASKVYDVEVLAEKTESSVKSLIAKDIIWKKKAAFEQNEALDGCYVLRTDRTDLGDSEIWRTYMMLTRVERAFRSLKSSLGLRPNFHQIERRADAHLFISVLAYHILHIIEHRLRQHGDHRCWQTICQVLSTHQRVTLEYDVKEQQQVRRCHLRICSRPEPEHSMIYHRLGLAGTPPGRRTYMAK